MVFFVGCEFQCFGDVEFLLLEVCADKLVRLFWFEGDVDASCFDHEDAGALFF